jgi:hypothetical protein
MLAAMWLVVVVAVRPLRLHLLLLSLETLLVGCLACINWTQAISPFNKLAKATEDVMLQVSSTILQSCT